jgi:SH3 domain protein
MRRLRAWSVAIGSSLIALLVSPVDASAAWVKDEVNLQIRTGAGSQFRITGRIKTGDTVDIIGKGEGWTNVRTGEGLEGWVPAGFLQAEPPARVALERVEREASKLRNEVERLTGQTDTLRSSNEDLSGRDEGQRSEMDRLTRENYELRAGARWPEWITGGGIVLVGMALGMILSRSSGRRRQPRIRL